MKEVIEILIDGIKKIFIVLFFALFITLCSLSVFIILFIISFIMKISIIELMNRENIRAS